MRYQRRCLAVGLLTGLVFHSNSAMIVFMENLSITGTLLLLAIHGSGRYNLDARQARQE